MIPNPTKTAFPCAVPLADPSAAVTRLPSPATLPWPGFTSSAASFTVAPTRAENACRYGDAACSEPAGASFSSAKRLVTKSAASRAPSSPVPRPPSSGEAR